MNGEDCAFTSTDKSSGRRGLCGTIFIFKIAGAVAEDGENLHTIVASTKQVSASMRPMGLALRAATLALHPTWAPCSTWSVIAWRKGYGCMGSLGWEVSTSALTGTLSKSCLITGPSQRPPWKKWSAALSAKRGSLMSRTVGVECGVGDYGSTLCSGSKGTYVILCTWK